MERAILSDIAFGPDMPRLMKTLHIRQDSADSAEFQLLAGAAQAAARPQALYLTAYIDRRDHDSLTLNGVEFTSRVLRVNLEKSERVFAFVVTAGQELDEWSRPLEGNLQHFWAETLKESALEFAFDTLKHFLIERYQLGLTAEMSPGSLPDWPLTQQKPLFELLGGAREIGVELSSSLMMRPTKSVSGIRFPVEERFESCQLCNREKCPGRRVKYTPSLYEKYGLQASAICETQVIE
jgi:hypothetical protein